MDWPYSAHLSSLLEHGLSLLGSFFSLSDSTAEDNPLELLYSKLSQLEHSFIDLKAASLTENGPASKRKQSRKPVASPLSPKRHRRIANVTDSLSEEQPSVLPHSPLHQPFSQECCLCLLQEYGLPSGVTSIGTPISPLRSPSSKWSESEVAITMATHIM